MGAENESTNAGRVSHAHKEGSEFVVDVPYRKLFHCHRCFCILLLGVPSALLFFFFDALFLLYHSQILQSRSSNIFFDDGIPRPFLQSIEAISSQTRSRGVPCVDCQKVPTGKIKMPSNNTVSVHCRDRHGRVVCSVSGIITLDAVCVRRCMHTRMHIRII